MQKFKYYLYFLLWLLLFTSIFVWLYINWHKVPDKIYLREGNIEEFDFSIPATAVIQDNKFDLSKPLSLRANQSENYTLKVKLFGCINFKETEVNVINSRKLYPAGIPVGIYVKTKGVLTIQTGEYAGETGEVCSPAKDLKKGDYILAVNGMELQGKQDLIRMIAESDGSPLNLKIKRKESILYLDVIPAKDREGEYKLGIWVRDNAQGVGTLTYIDEEGNFGALGHGINDIDVCELMDMEYGKLYDTDIVAIKKGEEGLPGEMTGLIAYEKERQLGDIFTNSQNGIYGQLLKKTKDSAKNIDELDFLPIGLKQDVRLGKAEILSSVDGVTEAYKIEITEIHLKENNSGRNMKIKITDDNLLNKTGGIIQGMSGSPIIQNGRVIGAVTHVLVNDPQKGYGIFIENMLNASN